MKVKLKAILVPGILIWIGMTIFMILVNMLQYNLIDVLKAFSDDSDDPYVGYRIVALINRIIQAVILIGAGYVSARMAREEELLHGGLTGFLIALLATVISYVLMLYSTFQPSLSLAMLWPFLINTALGVFGGFIYQKRKDKQRLGDEPTIEQKIENLGND